MGSPLVIYGSCLSRDTYEHALRPHLGLRRYIARQSLISALRPSTTVEPDYDALDHDFQRRVLREDLEGSLAQVLDPQDDRPLVMLWDLVDERLGVYLLDDGSVVTRSLELIRSGADATLGDRATALPFGSADHLRAWAASLDAFCRRLWSMPRPTTVLALDVPWAEHDERGCATPSSFGTSAAEANTQSRPYFALLRSRPEIDVLTIPGDTVVADSGHRWGPAPFHLSGRTYDAIGAQVIERLTEPTPTRRRP